MYTLLPAEGPLYDPNVSFGNAQQPACYAHGASIFFLRPHQAKKKKIIK